MFPLHYNHSMSSNAQAPQIETAVNLCSRCDQPLDTTGFPRWCKACQTKYRKELAATKREMQESRGYAAGVSAMRDYLARQFAERYGPDVRWSGTEISQIIKQCRGPFDSSPPASGQPS